MIPTTDLFNNSSAPAGPTRNNQKFILVWALLTFLIIGGGFFVYSHWIENIIAPSETSTPAPLPSTTTNNLPISFNNLVFAVESQYAEKHPSYTADIEGMLSLINGAYKKNTRSQFTSKIILFDGTNNCDITKDQRICDELLNNPQIQATDIPIFIGYFEGITAIALSNPRTHIVIETCSALKKVEGPIGHDFSNECNWSKSVESLAYLISHELGHVFGIGHNGSADIKDLTEFNPIIQGDIMPMEYRKDPMTANLNLKIQDLEFGPLSSFIINNNLDLQKTRINYEIYPQTIKLRVTDSGGIPLTGADVRLFCAGEYEYSAQAQEREPRFIFTSDANGETILQGFSRPEGWFSVQDALGLMATNPKILDNACTLTLIKINKAGYVGTTIPVWSFLLRKARVMDGAKIYIIPAVLNQ